MRKVRLFGLFMVLLSAYGLLSLISRDLGVKITDILLIISRPVGFIILIALLIVGIVLIVDPDPGD